MATPGADGRFRVVVIREVILGDLRVKACRLVTCIFLIQRVGIVLRVTRKEYLSATLGFNGVNSRNVGGGKNFKPLYRLDVLTSYGGIA